MSKLTRRERAAGRKPHRVYPPSLVGRLCATSPHALAPAHVLAPKNWRDRERTRKVDKAKRQLWEEQAAEARAWRAAQPSEPALATEREPVGEPAEIELAPARALPRRHGARRADPGVTVSATMPRPDEVRRLREPGGSPFETVSYEPGDVCAWVVRYEVGPLAGMMSRIGAEAVERSELLCQADAPAEERERVLRTRDPRCTPEGDAFGKAAGVGLWKALAIAWVLHGFAHRDYARLFGREEPQDAPVGGDDADGADSSDGASTGQPGGVSPAERR